MTCLDECVEACLDQFEELGYDKSMLVGVGIATQRETTLVWDRETGQPLYNAGELLHLFITSVCEDQCSTFVLTE